MNQQPLISIVVPVYNESKNLRNFIESVQNQTYQNVELIMIDDGSQDETVQIAKKMGVDILINEKNLGQGITRNKGARLAKGEIIAHTDGDVILPPKWLENIVKDMREHNVKCVGGNYCGSVGDSFVENFSFYELVFRRRNMPEFVNTLVANNFASTKDVFFEAGGFGEQFKCEDMLLSYNISRKHKIYWDKNNGVYHLFDAELKKYLKQQYHFARDNVVVYWQYPGLLKVKTHQGRQLYFEVVLIFLFYLVLIAGLIWPVSLFFSVLPLLLIILINIKFLAFLAKKKTNWLKSLGVIIARNFVCSFGIVSGIMHVCLIIVKSLSMRNKTVAKA